MFYVYALCFIFFSKNKAIPATKVSKILLKPTKLSNLQISTKNKNEFSNATSKIDTFEAEKKKKQDEANQLCWERVQRQMGPEVFFEKNQDFLQKTVGAWFYNHEEPPLDYKSTSTEDSFFLGLTKAGLIEGLNSKMTIDEESLNQAMLLLKQIHSEDPDNAAPIVFMALIEQRRNNLTESQSWFNLAANSKYFDTYQKNVSEKIFSLVENTDDLIQAISLNSQTPSLSYMQLRKFLIETKDSKVSSLMIKDNRKISDSFESVSYLSVEYAIGFSVLESNQVNNSYPDYQSEFILNRNDIDAVGERTFKKLMQDCDIRTLEANVRLLKEFILNNKNKAKLRYDF